MKFLINKGERYNFLYLRSVSGGFETQNMRIEKIGTSIWGPTEFSDLRFLLFYYGFFGVFGCKISSNWGGGSVVWYQTWFLL